MEGNDSWLSKAHPPKAFLKTPATCIRKGPLSRSTPPRRLMINNSSRNPNVSYLTQNSPPPTQLKTARKQSTLNDYFGINEDNCKSELKETALATTVQGFLCEQPLQMAVKESNRGCDYKERNFRHSLCQNHMKDRSSFSERKVLTEKSLQDNILQDCKRESSSYLNQDTETKTCYTKSFEHQNSVILAKETMYIAKNDTGELTFSEGLKFMSQEEIIECDNSESFSVRQNHGLAKDHNDNSVPTKCEDLDKRSLIKNRQSFDRFIKENSSKYGELSVSSLQPEADDFVCLGLNDDVQTGSQNIISPNSFSYVLSAVEKDTRVDRKSTDSPAMQCILLSQKTQKPTGYLINNSNTLVKHSSTLGHTDMDEMRMLQDSNKDQGRINRGEMRMLQDSDTDQDRINRGEMRMLQNSDIDQDRINMGEMRMLQDSDIDQDRINRGEMRMLQDSDTDQDRINRGEMRMLQYSDRDQDSIDFNISNFSDNKSLRDANIGVVQWQHESLQDENTPNFTEEPLSVNQRNGTDINSVYSQLSVLRSDEFHRKKQQYMLDIGTIAFSENK